MTKTQWIKIGKGALIAMGGALLTYVSTVVLPMIEGNELVLGLSTAASVMINAARKWLESKSEVSK